MRVRDVSRTAATETGTGGGTRRTRSEPAEKRVSVSGTATTTDEIVSGTSGGIVTAATNGTDATETGTTGGTVIAMTDETATATEATVTAATVTGTTGGIATAREKGTGTIGVIVSVSAAGAKC